MHKLNLEPMIYPLAQPQITQADRQAVTDVLLSRHLSRGPVIQSFERDFAHCIGTKFASAVSSGTAGLILALQALGVKQGDEVITVSFTVPATVNSIVAVGALPVLVDIDTENLGMCPTALLAAISPKTKAIIVVHAFGQAAAIKEIIGCAKKYRIKVIEDACEAIGNSVADKKLGSFADIGVFAFYPNKQITTGEGGMLVTNDADLQQKFELLKNHGRSMNGELYDQISFGWNFRMSDINAALGLSQLKRLDKIISQRQKVAQLYTANLANDSQIICPKFNSPQINSAWFVYVIQINNPDFIKNKLAKRGIQCGRYFAPVHLQPYYRKKLPSLKLDTTEKIAAVCLALPFYPQLTTKDVDYICHELRKAYK